MNRRFSGFLNCSNDTRQSRSMQYRGQMAVVFQSLWGPLRNVVFLTVAVLCLCPGRTVGQQLSRANSFEIPTIKLPAARFEAGDGSLIGARIDAQVNVSYPESASVINVQKSPYFAKGDGVTDDTDAIQRALLDVMGQHKMLYFPNGIYLISRTLEWSKKNSDGKDAWGKNFLQGQNPEKTIIRLKDATFTDSNQPASMMWCGGFGSADWFHNYIQDMTFDVGKENPGAIALQFYSNNSGAIRNCRFLSSTGVGKVGLDLGHRDMNGPLLVRNCEVVGFERGISTARAVNGQTFEHISLRNQTQFGLDNEGQTISIRGFLSENTVPAVRSYGALCLVEARLTGTEGAQQWPAVINYNGGRIFLRDVITTGYKRSVGDVRTPDWFAAVRGEETASQEGAGPVVSEYSSQETFSVFPSTPLSPRLKIEEPPEIPWDAPETWANVDHFGADPTGQQDSSAAIQEAIDSGATTVFLPGSYQLKSTVVIRGQVRRVIGVGGMIDYFSSVKPDFRITDGASPEICLEHFAYIHGGIEIDTPRTILFRSVADCDLTFTDRAANGTLFFEDFVTHNLRLNQQNVWARQLNVENEGTHIVNTASRLWVLGYKTERGGTLLETRGGGVSEVLGGFSYTTTAGTLAPMFVTHNSSVFTFFTEVCYNGDPFSVRIEETQGTETRRHGNDEAHTAPYSGMRGKR